MERVHSGGKFCLLFVFFSLLTACTHLRESSLDGGWVLIAPNDRRLPVDITSLDSNRYSLYHPDLILSGVYRLEDGVLTLEEPNNPRAVGFVLSVLADGHLRVVVAPPVRLTGERYLGADLRRSE